MTLVPAVVNIDSWANEARANETHGKDATLVAEQGSGSRKWIYLKPEVPWASTRGGITVVSAKLRVVLTAANPTGDTTLLAFRIEEPWQTSTLKWAKRPTTVTNSDGSAVVASAAPADTIVEIDVTAAMQSVANGAPYQGFNLRPSSAATRGPLKFGAGNGPLARRPTLLVDWTSPPDVATGLSPGSGKWVSTRKPLLRWVFGDVTDPEPLQSGFQVQIDDVDTFAAPDYDSGTIPSGASELDVNATAYAGLPTDGTVRYWRVRTIDRSGVTGPWTAAQAIRYCPLGSVTISAPGTTTPDLRPTVTWSFAPPALPTGVPSTAQTAWQAMLEHFVTATGKWEVVADSGLVTGTETSWVPNRSLPVVGDNYRFRVWVKGPLAREAIANGADRATQTKAFTWTPAGAVTNPAALVATITDGVWVDLAWTRATRPTSWTLVADGLVVAEGIDVTPTGTSYAYRWYGALPRKVHSLKLHAVELSAGVYQTSTGTTVAATTDPEGIWLVDAADGRKVHIAGKESLGGSIGEQSSLHPRIGNRAPVLITEMVEGYNGDVGGTLVDWNGMIARTMKATLIDLREQSQSLRLILGDLNLPVVIWDVEANPTPDVGDQRFVCSFSFAQIGEFERL